ncbi:formyltransferase family protein [Bacillus tianshenii]|nr:formyltransferase family protein [Bacillus tianshenii]
MSIVFLVGNNRELCLYRCCGAGIKIDHVIAFAGQKSRLDSWEEACKKLNVPLSIIDKGTLVPLLQKLNPQLAVTIGFPLLIHKEGLNSAENFINVHPTLLPKYRGAHSGWYILANNEKESGVTIHFLSSEIDEGDIISQGKFKLSSFDTPRSMYKKSRELEAELLLKVVTDFKDGVNFQRIKQNEKEATLYKGLRTPEDSKIDPSKPILELFHQIRACDPNLYPAFFEYEGQRVCIKLWRPEKPEGEKDLL